MQVLFALKRDIDIQQDAYLRTGAVLAAPGPDRAYLHYMGRDAQGRECEEVAALWVLDPPASAALAAGLGAPDPQCCGDRPFRVLWIRDGIIAADSQPIGIDRAVWLVHALAAQDVLDRDTQLFGRERVEVGYA